MIFGTCCKDLDRGHTILTSRELTWSYTFSWDVRGEWPLNSMTQIHTSVTLITSRDLMCQHAFHISVIAHISWGKLTWHELTRREDSVSPVLGPALLSRDADRQQKQSATNWTVADTGNVAVLVITASGRARSVHKHFRLILLHLPAYLLDLNLRSNQIHAFTTAIPPPDTPIVNKAGRTLHQYRANAEGTHTRTHLFRPFLLMENEIIPNNWLRVIFSHSWFSEAV